MASSERSASSPTRDLRLAIVARYGDAEMAEAYVASTDGGDDTVLELTPEAWPTVDDGKL